MLRTLKTSVKIRRLDNTLIEQSEIATRGQTTSWTGRRPKLPHLKLTSAVTGFYKGNKDLTTGQTRQKMTRRFGRTTAERTTWFDDNDHQNVSVKYIVVSSFCRSLSISMCEDTVNVCKSSVASPPVTTSHPFELILVLPVWFHIKYTPFPFVLMWARFFTKPALMSSSHPRKCYSCSHRISPRQYLCRLFLPWTNSKHVPPPVIWHTGAEPLFIH